MAIVRSVISWVVASEGRRVDATSMHPDLLRLQPDDRRRVIRQQDAVM
jgi:hypothetical protein